MKSGERLIWIFLVAALIVLLLFKSCSKQMGGAGVVSILTQTTIDTIPGKSIDHPVPVPYAVYYADHDTLKVHDTLPGKPYPVYVPDTAKKLIQLTAADIERIQTELNKIPIPVLYYPDTLCLGNNGFVVLKDSIQGLLKSRSFTWNIYQTNTFTKETTTEKKRIKGFLGLEYIYPVNYLGGAFLLQFKNDNILKVNYGFLPKTIPQYGAGYYFKIKYK